MKRVALLILTLLPIAALGANHLQVIYPRPSQSIAAVESTFIFGNTNPAAKLFINGVPVTVHEEGGFLAFLPVKQGDFVFDLVSVMPNDTCKAQVKVMIGSTDRSKATPIDLSTLTPGGRTVLGQDDLFEFTIKARRGGQPYCRFAGDKTWTPLAIYGPAEGSPFGDMQLALTDTGWMTYYGALSLRNIVDSSRLHFVFMESASDTKGMGAARQDSSAFYVVKGTDFASKSVVLTGRPRIIRYSPGKGYRLVNQPAGTRLQYAGETPAYYRVRLAPNLYGYVRKTEAELVPAPTALIRGEARLIRVDDHPRHVEITVVGGQQLPFDIVEEGDLLRVELYGLVANTDWIRINGAQDYVRAIWWDQPSDGVYRINVRWRDDRFWGYFGRHESGMFILRIKKKPHLGGFLKRTLSGLKIVVDPGHSRDSGAVGPTGLVEKDVNLQIAHLLRQELEQKGAEVIMTRTGDEDVPLYDRVDLAIRAEADILISIHNNALPDGVNPFVNNGTSVYYYFSQSRPLAEAIHKHLLARLGLPDFGLYYGNLALPRVSDFPAVLVECAFMMLPEQEAALKKESFRRQIAKAICEGVEEYLQ